MKRIITIIILCSLALCASTNSAIASLNITFNSATDLDGNLTTPESLAVVETFDDDTPGVGGLPTTAGWTWSGNGHVVNGTTEYYAAPGLTDTSNYFAIPKSGTGTATVEVDFGADNKYLGLYWGSMDQYNQIEFYNDGFVIANGTWNGSTVGSLADGNQWLPGTNKYVNFYFTDQVFDKVVFTSKDIPAGGTLYGPYAFEFDNLAVVPLPATILLGLIGFGIGGWKIRKSL